MIDTLAGRAKLGVVANCSIMMGRASAALVPPAFDVVMTAEEAGFYKPRSEPYVATLAAMDMDPARVLFVAGSAADMPGAMAPGMPVYWHNRIGVKAEAEPLYHERSLASALLLTQRVGMVSRSNIQSAKQWLRLQENAFVAIFLSA